MAGITMTTAVVLFAGPLAGFLALRYARRIALGSLVLFALSFMAFGLSNGSPRPPDFCSPLGGRVNAQCCSSPRQAFCARAMIRWALVTTGRSTITPSRAEAPSPRLKAWARIRPAQAISSGIGEKQSFRIAT